MKYKNITSRRIRIVDSKRKCKVVLPGESVDLDLTIIPNGFEVSKPVKKEEK